MRTVIVFYVTGHGLGHATRDVEVINHVLQSRPGTRVVIRSSVPSWVVEHSVRGTVPLDPCDTDTGVVQSDSLQLDEDETARQAAAFYHDFPARVEAEASMLRALDASLVVGDVPPLAFAAAARVDLPSIALANFTWDWIYEAYPRFDKLAPGVQAIIREAYASTSIGLRLPFSGGFEPMRAVTHDVPLVARRSRRSRDSIREILNLDERRPVVLVSFGGHGTPLPFEAIARQNDVTLVVTDHEAPEPQVEGSDPRLRRFTRENLSRLKIRYEDLVAAADVVVSKPGYGIVSECIANHAALLYTSRGHFVEQEVLVGGMPRVMRCQFIEQDQLKSGQWQAAIETLLNQPRPPDQMDVNGAAVAAEVILRTAGA